ncbi:DUF3857 domain-containing protein [Mangrovivirga sp. M17]|uniref:DUF3857 domain-containing protein n=1 Tax=Mangrovivirga halotolerans TaxID=2993936 RepID=A0ABT3RNA8_9BACT|nr:DUF3857 domain-containing protein [Mangrovivirga halotolerans]MCX2743086.1 DUF3857 domain-containing protein [Mangrovivirga halotolerans]
MRIFSTFGILFLTVLSVMAQRPIGYDWQENREPYKLSKVEEEEGVYLLKNHIQFEYVYEGDELFLYKTLHKIIRVNNDEALNENNRIYISMDGAVDLVEIHARAIQEDGEIIELDKNNIKEVKDEEAGRGFRIFAIEGAGVGSEIEYFYTIKREPKFFSRDYLQGLAKVKHASYAFATPANLVFEFKSYGGFPELEEVESEEEEPEFTILKGEIHNVPQLEKESFAIINEYRPRVDFKLTYNLYAGRSKIFSWEEISNKISKQTYSIEKRELKDLEKWIKKLDVEDLASYEKIAKIEDAAKKEFFVENNSGASSNISSIIDNKVTTDFGIFRFLINAAELLGVDHEIVFTNNRNDVKFDGDFESYLYLDDYLIYFPESGDFIAPDKPEYRIGLIPSELSANKGLFIRRKIVRDMIIPIVEVREIPAHDYTKNFDNLEIKVSFDENVEKNAISVTRSFKGYTPSMIKSVIPFIEEKQKDEILEDLIKFISPDAEFNSKEFAQLDLEWSQWHEPMVIKGDITSSHFIEVAGNTILFKAGELIGQQSELYQESERKMEVVNAYNRGYKRTIEITIPEGYKIENLEDLNIEEVTKNEAGEEIYLFKSEYTIKDNKLIISIDELYDQIYYPADKFEDYRKVINAAADFNKIVLVMKETV